MGPTIYCNGHCCLFVVPVLPACSLVCSVVFVEMLQNVII